MATEPAAPPTTLQLHAALPPLSHLLHPSLFISAVRITRQIRLALISRVHVSYACQSLDPVDSLLISPLTFIAVSTQLPSTQLVDIKTYFTSNGTASYHSTLRLRE